MAFISFNSIFASVLFVIANVHAFYPTHPMIGRSIGCSFRSKFSPFEQVVSLDIFLNLPSRMDYSTRAFRLRSDTSNVALISMDHADLVSLDNGSARSGKENVRYLGTAAEPNTYRYFDFESSAEAAYVSPAVSAEEMFEILKAEAGALIDDVFLQDQLRRHVLSHGSMATCLASVLSFKLANDNMKEHALYELFNNVFIAHPKLISDMVSFR